MKHILEFGIRRLIISTALFLAFFITFDAVASAQEQYKVEIKKVEINGMALDSTSRDSILMSTVDTITIRYQMNAPSYMRKPFLFKPSLQNSTESPKSRPVNRKVVQYGNLSEDDYVFVISAFEPGNDWVAAPSYLKFRIDDNEYALTKEIADAKKEIEELKKIEVEKPVQAQLFGFDRMSLLVGLGSGIFIMLTVTVPFARKNSGKQKNKTGINSEKNNENNTNKNNISGDESMSDEMIQIGKEEYEQLLANKNKFESESKALRNQIDTLQIRGNELSKTNKELQSKSEAIAKSKKEIEELQKQKDDLFAVIIHDIKNPVSLIKNLVDLLRSYDLTATEQHKIIDDIFETTTKIVTLSQEVSKIIALECSTLILNIDKEDVNEILKDVHRRNFINADKKKIKMDLVIDEKLPDIEMDINKIDDIIDNLISNAIKYSEIGGKIKISSKLVSDKIVIEVHDNGQGLSEEDIQRAFRKGGRLSAKPTANEHSSGLGLWIVKKFVDAHNGKVWVKSSVGKGSTFSFSLPLEQGGSTSIKTEDM